MAKMFSYDVVVIGSGPAGFASAEAARKLGAKVCLIEKDKLGGECPNYACIPSKALLKTAKVYRNLQESRKYGINFKSGTVDFDKIVEYREKVIETVTGGKKGERFQKIAEKLGVEIISGTASFIDEHTLEVGEKLIKGKTIIVATGTVDYIPPIHNVDQVHYLGWKEALQLKRQPKSLAIIGGGPVGSEIATFFGSLGTRVILFEAMPHILSNEDKEIAQIATEAMKKNNIEVHDQAKVMEIIDGRGGVYGLKVEENGVKQTHAVEQVIISTGKKTNLENLAIELSGVILDDRGSLKTDLEQRTNVKHIFSAGDADGGMRFTHTAHHEGRVAGHNAGLLALRKRSEKMKRQEKVVPRATFIDPEVASVGETEDVLSQKFGQLLIGRSLVSHLGRGITDNQHQGLIKIIAHPKTRKILGGHIIGPNAGELIHEIALAMHLNTTVDKLGSLIHAFPTYSEGVMVAANSVELE